MSDYISRADAIEVISKHGDLPFAWWKMICRELQDLPSADAVEVDRTSEWVAVRREEYEDLIADAEQVTGKLKNPCDSLLTEESAECKEQKSKLESADAEPTVIRAKTFMRKEDFDKWAEDIKKQNKNIVCIPCDAEVVSADAVQGEWIRHELFGNPWFTCSECNCHGRNDFNYCPNCGADMRGNK